MELQPLECLVDIGHKMSSRYEYNPGGVGGTPFQESLGTTVCATSGDTFTLTNTPIADLSVVFYYGGICQLQGTNYTIAGSTLTLAGTGWTSGIDVFAAYSY